MLVNNTNPIKNNVNDTTNAVLKENTTNQKEEKRTDSKGLLIQIFNLNKNKTKHFLNLCFI